MKATKMLAILVLALAVMVWLANVSKAVSMGTAWTYQGRLIDANDTADGEYDFQFKLFDDANTVTGNQLGTTIDINDLDVIDGYFTVELDFGSDAFDGDARWLEILVRPGDSNDFRDFVTLSPRQEVTPTPYALQTRGIFVDDRMNIGMGTTSPKGKLHVDGGKAADDTDASDIMIKAQDGGDAVRGLIGRRGGNIILLPGEGGESPPLTPPGPSGKVGIGTTKPSTKLDVVGTVNATAFVGDGSGLTNLPANPDSDWVIDGNDMYSALSGNVGIGTESPEAKLEVAGDVTVKKIGEDVDISLVSGIGSSSKLLFGNRFEPGAAAIKFDNLTQVLSFKNWLTDDALVIAQDGKVGIGTTSPGAKLEVRQNDWQDIVKVGTPDTSNRLILSSGPDYASVSGGQTNQNHIVISHSTGNVGIGHSLSLPQAKLQVNGDLKVKGDVTVDGAYVGSFPRPAYDSGWVPLLQNQELTCIHDLGGNVDNYVVDMQMKDTDPYGYGITNYQIGSDRYYRDEYAFLGAWWYELTTSSVKAYRESNDQRSDQVRIRIWVYQ